MRVAAASRSPAGSRACRPAAAPLSGSPRRSWPCTPLRTSSARTGSSATSCRRCKGRGAAGWGFDCRLSDSAAPASTCCACVRARASMRAAPLRARAAASPAVAQDDDFQELPPARRHGCCCCGARWAPGVCAHRSRLAGSAPRAWSWQKGSRGRRANETERGVRGASSKRRGREECRASRHAGIQRRGQEGPPERQGRSWSLWHAI